MEDASNKVIVLNGCCLERNRNYTLNIMMQKSKPTIIRGVVYSEEGCPVKDAVVEVREINLCRSITNILGYTYTDCEGQYALAICIDLNAYYEIKVYSPLLMNG